MGLSLAYFGKVFSQGLEYLAGVGDDAAHATEVVYGYASFDGETYVLYHLSGIEFDGEYAFDLMREAC